MPIHRTMLHRSSFRSLTTLVLAGTALAGCSADRPGPAAPDASPSALLAKKAAAPSEQGNGGLPARYVLPGTQVFPEGIALDERTQTVYVTSTTDGTIFCGDLGDATLRACFPGDPASGRTTAVGIDVGSEGQLFVAGGQTGRVFVLDRTGATLASLQGGSGDTFVNDVAVVRGDTAYVTDSRNPVIYRVTRNAAGAYVLEPWLNLTGSIIQYGAGFNLNGIAASPDGGTLYVVQSNTGLLYRIDTRTRAITRVDVGGATFVNGDGLELRGSTLYVVQNAQETITELRLQENGTTGRVVSTTTDASLMYPTTLVEARGRLLVVNSQFDKRGPGLTPVVPFTVSVIKKP